MRKRIQHRLPEKLSKWDYYRIIVSVLMMICGLLILCRSAIAGSNVMAFIVGAAILSFGVYRLKFVIDYFRKRGKSK